MNLLAFLVDQVLPPRETEAMIRGVSYEQFSQNLSPGLRGQGTQAVYSLFPYDDALAQACILEAKFQDSRTAAGLLGAALCEFLYEFMSESEPFNPSPPVIVPIPLSQTRLKERGYNQTERIAQAALKSGISIDIQTDLLVRTRSTVPQTSLTGTARRTNVAGAFSACRPCEWYRTYIVLDDVVTTGHTMLAACQALRAAGAQRLLPLTLAY